MVDALTTYTRAEVAQHNKKEDCWVIFDKKVYNITEFIEDHPGGEDVVPVSYTHLTLPTRALV